MNFLNQKTRILNTKKELNWGILGAGIIAHTMADALKNTPGNRLVAVASKTTARAQTFAAKHGVPHAYDYQHLLDSTEVDVVYVATTHNFHYQNARLALEHGKHVLVEKPFTVNADEAQKLVELARARKLFLMEAIWTRFLPVMKMLKRNIADGEIGQVRQMTISFGGFVSPEYKERLTNPALAGGVTLDMGIYPISFACYLLGELPVEIRSMAQMSAGGVDELASYMFRFPSGCLVSISTSFNLKMTNEAIIYGAEGYIVFPEFAAGQGFTTYKHEGTNTISDETVFNENRPYHGFEYQLAEVAHCIKSGALESKIIRLDETIAIMQVMDNMRQDWGLVYPFEKS